MEWTDIRLTVAKADAENAEAVATMIAEGGIYIEDYSAGAGAGKLPR